jgi:hypothetical protein
MIPAVFIFACAQNTFFLLPSWWEYLGQNPDCSANFSGVGDIWLVGLAIVDILLRVAGLIAVVAIMAGGISYMTAGGNPEKAASARKRIISAIGGLAIVMLATIIVTFVGKSIGG